MFYICHHAVPPTSVPSFLPQKQKTGQSGSWKESGLAWVSWESFSFLLFCVFIFKTSQLLLKFQMSFAVRTCYLTIFLHSEFLNFFYNICHSVLHCLHQVSNLLSRSDGPHRSACPWCCLLAPSPLSLSVCLRPWGARAPGSVPVLRTCC